MKTTHSLFLVSLTIGISFLLVTAAAQVNNTTGPEGSANTTSVTNFTATTISSVNVTTIKRATTTNGCGQTSSPAMLLQISAALVMYRITDVIFSG
uniref:Uncharacterized protein n=1 Tax=Arion vulgaris TaxID=1028688 RepID=A0A0B6ZIR5_9EUPU